MGNGVFLGWGSRGLGVSGMSTYTFGGDGTLAWPCLDSPQETETTSAKFGGLSLGQGVLKVIIPFLWACLQRQYI
jgi:hypothetical protein